MTLQCTVEKLFTLYRPIDKVYFIYVQTLDDYMDPDLEIYSQILVWNLYTLIVYHLNLYIHVDIISSMLSQV